MIRTNPAPRRMARGRAALLWAAACFLGMQVALDAALTVWRPLRDPEYGWRLESLRARMAEKPPGRPLILFLGSSRVAMGIRPGLLPTGRTASGGPVVFNYGLCGAGPVAELLCVRRLLADGVHPDCLFVEAWPTAAARDADSQLTEFPRERLWWDDLRVLRPFRPGAASEARRWCKDLLVPWLSYRARLLNQWAPAWAGAARGASVPWDGLDGWGWLAVPDKTKDDGRWRVPRDAEGRRVVTSTCLQYAPSMASLRAYAELAALCRKEQITLAFVAMPDAYLGGYSPPERRDIDRFLDGLSKDNGAPLIDARDWADDDDFYDGCHLTPEGAAAFTARFGREVLRPYLEGERGR